MTDTNVSRSKRPGVLIAAVILMAVLCLAALVFSLMYTVSASDHGDEEGTGVGMTMVALAAIQVVLVVFVWLGKNWARIALAIIVAANVILGMVSGQGITGLGAVVAVALMYVPSANAWFLAQKPAAEDA